jgi:hypothetical protein
MAISILTIVMMVLMKVTIYAALGSLTSIMTLDAVAKRTNSNAATRNASAETTFVMALPSVLTCLMRLTLNVASRTTSSMTTRNVAANQALNSLVQTVIVSP